MKTTVYFSRRKDGKLAAIGRGANTVPAVAATKAKAEEGGFTAVAVEVDVPEPLPPFKEEAYGYVAFARNDKWPAVTVDVFNSLLASHAAVYDDPDQAIEGAVDECYGCDTEDDSNTNFIARKVRVTIEAVED